MVKVERSYPAPASLALEEKKTNGRYNCRDVVERLEKDFNNKCYICEISPVQDPEIEHRLPHKNGRFPERKFDWNNLFWSCGHCNSIKKDTRYDAGIIDCCAVDPEEKMSCFLIEGKARIIAKEDDELTLNTVHLLNEVFNKENTGMRIVKSQVRTNELNEEMSVFLKVLRQYCVDKRMFSFRTLKGLLQRDSRFAAFKRDYIRQHKDRFPELAELL